VPTCAGAPFLGMATTHAELFHFRLGQMRVSEEIRLSASDLINSSRFGKVVPVIPASIAADYGKNFAGDIA
jgi:hypothetical protein